MPGLVLSLTSNPKIPLALRRKIGKAFIKRDGRDFCIEIDGRPFEGKLDNYIEWLAYVTRDYFEYTYINLLRSLLSGGTALDVGANVGNHTHAFSGFFDTVHAFEPFGKVADRLEAKGAELPNVEVHRVALSDQVGELSFEAPADENWGTGKITDGGSLKVPVEIGDCYLRDRVDGVNFIKIDVEGHELCVLRGLTETIRKFRPVVMFEVPSEWRKNGWEGLEEAGEIFPGDYLFVGFRGQSTFPVQTSLAKVVPVDCHDPSSISGKLSYLLGYGPERGFSLRNGRLQRG